MIQYSFMDLNSIGTKVIELTYEVGKFISSERESFSSSKVETKGLHDFVSYVDKQAEIKLVNGLKGILPGSGFITEEKTAGNSNEDYIWIIDPLDGTTNFIHNVAPHSISIALQFKNKTILGVIYELVGDEMFYSWDGTPVFCNKKEISVTSSQHISDGLVATGFHINDFEKLHNHLKVVEQVVKLSHGIRRHGSAATDLAYVAMGRFDAFFEYGLSVWDVAAGAFLVEQANGKVTDYSGNDNYMFGGEILVGTPNVHEELLEILKNTM